MGVGLNLGPLEEKSVLLTIEPLLQLQSQCPGGLNKGLDFILWQEAIV